MLRKIAPVCFKRRQDQPEPRASLSPQEALREVEELRRMFTDLTGDPDLPIVRVVQRRKIQCS